MENLKENEDTQTILLSRIRVLWIKPALLITNKSSLIFFKLTLNE